MRKIIIATFLIFSTQVAATSSLEFVRIPNGFLSDVIAFYEKKRSRADIKNALEEALGDVQNLSPSDEKNERLDILLYFYNKVTKDR